ncbi:hypothetical protein ACFYYL_41830 [Actinomadura geliboluensis]|uniref:hypothetical protein n=1 Tax=Actinomadura geliboluensis TaxID=882440 RepID=UPI0036D03F94
MSRVLAANVLDQGFERAADFDLSRYWRTTSMTMTSDDTRVGQCCACRPMACIGCRTWLS